MHDPLVVAFEIRRPWPRRASWGGAGRHWWFPPLVTIWHREPGGHDSGEVCRHFTRVQGVDGTWRYKFRHGWKFHVHHWKLQVHPLQALRRWALTRCAWCGGRSRKGDRVNISHQWDGPRGRWWRGEPGLHHHDCSYIRSTHATCLCVAPILDNDTFGLCARCGKRRPFGQTVAARNRERLLAAIPAGKRDPLMYARFLERVKADTKQEASDV